MEAVGPAVAAIRAQREEVKIIVSFDCPSCGATVDVPAGGRTARCGGCHALVPVPTPATPEVPVSPGLPTPEGVSPADEPRPAPRRRRGRTVWMATAGGFVALMAVALVVWGEEITDLPSTLKVSRALRTLKSQGSPRYLSEIHQVVSGCLADREWSWNPELHFWPQAEDPRHLVWVYCDLIRQGQSQSLSWGEGSGRCIRLAVALGMPEDEIVERIRGLGEDSLKTTYDSHGKGARRALIAVAEGTSRSRASRKAARCEFAALLQARWQCQVVATNDEIAAAVRQHEERVYYARNGGAAARKPPSTGYPVASYETPQSGPASAPGNPGRYSQENLPLRAVIHVCPKCDGKGCHQCSNCGYLNRDGFPADGELLVRQRRMQAGHFDAGDELPQ